MSCTATGTVRERESDGGKRNSSTTVAVRQSTPTLAMGLAVPSVALRVCAPSVEGILLHEGKKHIGSMATLVKARLSELNVNYTMIPAETAGYLMSDGTASPGSCLELMQQNKSDWSLVHATSPVIGRNLMQGPVTGFERQSIVSAYQVGGGTMEHVGNVFQSLNNFDATLWLMVVAWPLILMLIQAVALCVQRMALRKHFHWSLVRGSWRQARQQVLAYCLRGYSGYQPVSVAVSVRIVSLTIVYYTFLIHLYMNNLFRTELSVVTPPDTIDYYEDMIKRKIKPLLYRTISDERVFMYAPADSIEGKIWALAKELSGGVMSQVLLDIDHALSGPSFQEFLDQTAALITSQTTILAIQKHGCALLAHPDHPATEGLDLHVSQDPHGQELVRVYDFNQQLPPVLKNYLFKRITKLLEGGIFKKDAELAEHMWKQGEVDKSHYTRCMQNEVITKDAIVTGPGLGYFGWLFAVCAALFTIAGVILLLEKWSHPRRRCVPKVRKNRVKRVAPSPGDKPVWVYLPKDSGHFRTEIVDHPA